MSFDGILIVTVRSLHHMPQTKAKIAEKNNRENWEYDVKVNKYDTNGKVIPQYN